MDMIKEALETIDSSYPYPMDEVNLRIEYETLFDLPVGSSSDTSPELMAHRIIKALRG